MNLPNNIKLANEIAQKIVKNYNASDTYDTGLKNEALIIATYAALELPVLMQINKVICRVISLRRENRPIPPTMRTGLLNEKQYIKSFADLKSLDQLQKIGFIIASVIKRKKEVIRVKNDAGRVNQLIDRAIPIDK